VATLRHAGTLLVDAQGQAQVRGAVEGVLPDSIHTAVLARLDRLPGLVRELLQLAAVAGTAITRSLVTALAAGADALATGERDGAIAAWEAAQAAFDLLGAAWDSQRVAEQLAAARGG